jgi:hypothetical protein
MAALACTKPVTRTPALGKEKKPLGDVLSEAVNCWGWQNRILHDNESETDYVTTTYIRHNQAFEYTLTASEKFQKVGIHVNSPIQIPMSRMVEVVLVANYFNMRSTMGGYYVTAGGDLCYRWAISVAGTQASVELFRALRDSANKSFDKPYNSFLSAAFTASSARDIIQKFQIFCSRA